MHRPIHVAPNITQYERAFQNEELVGSVFRIGDPAVSVDINAGERRYLVWIPEDHDILLANIAGWSGFVKNTEANISGGYSVIDIPKGTRSASSVLSGLEAWSGEKKEFLDFAAQYTKTIKKKFPGYIDVSLDLETIARTKDGQFFVTPPHFMQNDPTLINQWKVDFTEELKDVLLGSETEATTNELIADFFADINESRGVEQ